MDFRLKVFHSVATNLSFTKASKELFISQPAISKHIHELEVQYKTPLFDRVGSHIGLTHAGELLLSHTKQLLAAYRQMDFEMNLLTDNFAGELRLGASTTISQYVLPPVLASFIKKFPEIKVSLLNGNSRDIEQVLREGKITLGLVEGTAHQSTLHYTPFMRDELVVVAHTGSSLAAYDEISLKQLRTLPLVLRENGSGTLDVVEAALAEHQVKLSQLNVVLQMGSTESIKLFLENSEVLGIVSIRAVTRAAIFNGFKVKGIYRGYEGLIAGEVKELTTEDVSSIIQRGGTILKTARSETFTTPEGRKKAYKVIQKENINALIIIGGDGSLTGARIFAEEYDVTCIGLPGTIDNDLYGTDFTIGYDTALNTIVECVDKIRDTATSHDRIFFVEVMGRDAGFLAQNSAIASGAEAAIIPEDRTDVDQLETFIGRGFRKTKNSSIVIVTESPENKNGGAIYYADRVKKEYPGYDVRVSILGHLQRGGAPSANDRILASRLGEAAIQALMEGQRNVMIGIRNNEIVYVPFVQAIKKDKPIDKSLIRVLNELSI